MARACEICGRGPATGNNVSHSNRHTRRRWLVNLQQVRVLVNGTPRRMRVCTRCLRAGRVARAV
ncbi:MAG: 50S ribosomal protein L28 [Bacteroidota bacterium]